MEKNTSKNIHVVKRNGRWIVRGDSMSVILSVHPKQSDAIDAARKIAQNEKGELVIHGTDGRVRERNSYFPEPLPPKSPRKVLYPKSLTKSEERKIQEAINAVISERKEINSQ